MDMKPGDAPNSSKRCAVTTFCITVILALVLVLQQSDFHYLSLSTDPGNVKQIRGIPTKIEPNLLQKEYATSQNQEDKNQKSKNNSLPILSRSPEAMHLSKYRSATPPVFRHSAASQTLALKLNTSNKISENTADTKHISNFLMVIEALEKPSAFSAEGQNSTKDNAQQRGSARTPTAQATHGGNVASQEKPKAPAHAVLGLTEDAAAHPAPAPAARAITAAPPQAAEHVRNFLLAIEELDQP